MRVRPWNPVVNLPCLAAVASVATVCPGCMHGNGKLDKSSCACIPSRSRSANEGVLDVHPTPPHYGNCSPSPPSLHPLFYEPRCSASSAADATNCCLILVNLLVVIGVVSLLQRTPSPRVGQPIFFGFMLMSTSFSLASLERGYLGIMNSDLRTVRTDEPSARHTQHAHSVSACVTSRCCVSLSNRARLQPCCC
jgi:hypothetical protein